MLNSFRQISLRFGLMVFGIFAMSFFVVRPVSAFPYLWAENTVPTDATVSIGNTIEFRSTDVVEVLNFDSELVDSVVLKYKNTSASSCTQVGFAPRIASLDGGSDCVQQDVTFSAGETKEVTFDCTNTGKSTNGYLNISWWSNGSGCSSLTRVLSKTNTFGGQTSTSHKIGDNVAWDGWFKVYLDDGISAVCGDSAVEGSEECDDGGTVAGDGCSDVCVIEDGWSCFGEPSVCDADFCGDTYCVGSEDWYTCSADCPVLADVRKPVDGSDYYYSEGVSVRFGSNICYADYRVDVINYSYDLEIWDSVGSKWDDVVELGVSSVSFLVEDTEDYCSTGLVYGYGGIPDPLLPYVHLSGSYRIAVKAIVSYGGDFYVGDYGSWTEFDVLADVYNPAVSPYAPDEPTCTFWGETTGDGLPCLFDWLLYFIKPHDDAIDFFSSSLTGFGSAGEFGFVSSLSPIIGDDDVYCPLASFDGGFTIGTTELFADLALCDLIEDSASTLRSNVYVSAGMSGLVSLSVLFGIWRLFSWFVTGGGLKPEEY